jgi:2-phosphoglycerate kinase
MDGAINTLLIYSWNQWPASEIAGQKRPLTKAYEDLHAQDMDYGISKMIRRSLAE